MGQLFERMLVPVDGSKFSLEAVRLAARLAGVHGAEVRLIHVVDTAVLSHLYRHGSDVEEKIETDLERSARAFLRDMALETKDLGVEASVVLRRGAPHEEILDEVAAWGADLIVMGKLGGRGVGRILLGSVAERVIEFAEVPVLLASG